MSAARFAAALAKLERVTHFPKTMHATYWHRLSGAALEVLALIKVGEDGEPVPLLSSADAHARLLAMLQSRDRRLFDLPLNEVLGSLAELKATYADYVPMLSLLDAVRGAAVQHYLAKGAEGFRNSASASKERPSHQKRMAPYLRLAQEVLRSDRFVADNDKATRDRQAAAFERKVVAHKLEPVSERTRRRYFNIARAQLTGQ